MLIALSIAKLSYTHIHKATCEILGIALFQIMYTGYFVSIMDNGTTRNRTDCNMNDRCVDDKLNECADR